MMDQSQQARKPRGIEKLILKLKSMGRTQKTESAAQPATTTSTVPTNITSTQSEPIASTGISRSAPVEETSAQPTEFQTALESPPSTIPIDNTVIEARSSASPVPDSRSMPDLAIVIEVDDGEDVEEMYVDNEDLLIRANLVSVLPERYTAGPYAADRAKYERARAIFNRYDMKLEPAEWRAQSTSNILRIEKKPRMRVRWTCHACNTTFGRDKKCVKCAHDRCTDCIRYPVSRVGGKARKPIIIKPESSTGLADVPKTGSCHECKTEFTIGDKQCRNCQHEVCERCLKETIMSSPATAPTPLQNTNVVAV